MKQLNFKVLILLASMVLGLASCDNNEEVQIVNENGLIAEEQNVLDQLPNVIRIESYTDINGVTTIQTRSSNGNITTDDVAGTYYGKLKNVYMDKPFTDKNDTIITYITKNTDNNNQFDFEFKPFKIGKMPFSLSCDIDNIDLDSNAHFNVPKGDPRLAKKLVIGWFKFDISKMEGDFKPTKDGYNLTFTMESSGKIFFFEIKHAHIEYDGNK